MLCSRSALGTCVGDQARVLDPSDQASHEAVALAQHGQSVAGPSSQQCGTGALTTGLLPLSTVDRAHVEFVALASWSS